MSRFQESFLEIRKNADAKKLENIFRNNAVVTRAYCYMVSFNMVVVEQQFWLNSKFESGEGRPLGNFSLHSNNY